MPRKKRTELERVREARLVVIERIKILSDDSKINPEALRAFRELCQAAEDEARRDTEQAELKEVAERLQALISAHNQLSDIVEELRRPGRTQARGMRMG